MERSVKGTKMAGRTWIDRFQQLLPKDKHSNRYKLPEARQWGSTVHPASGYGANIIKLKTKHCIGVIRRNLNKQRAKTESLCECD